MPTPEQRSEARRVYGIDPTGYEAGRPEYPERVYDVLSARCGLRPGVSVLEIGPGTGRVTRRLLRSGAQVTVVEPDPALAAYLGRMAGNELTIRQETFEECELSCGFFDLVVAAMSFHWVDQKIGLRKLGSVVRAGGSVAIWWTLFGDPSRPDPFREATKTIIDSASPTSKHESRLPFELDTAGWRNALAAGAGLIDIAAELIRWNVRLDQRQLRALYSSMIVVRRRPAADRERILDLLESVAAKEFGGVVERPFVTALYTGRGGDRL